MSDKEYLQFKDKVSGKIFSTISNKDNKPLLCGDIVDALSHFPPNTPVEVRSKENGPVHLIATLINRESFDDPCTVKVTLFSSNSDGKEGVDYLSQKPA